MALVDDERHENRRHSENIERLQANICECKATFSKATGTLVRLDDEFVSLRSSLQDLEAHVSRKIEQV
jgi:hypothetical protein